MTDLEYLKGLMFNELIKYYEQEDVDIFINGCVAFLDWFDVEDYLENMFIYFGNTEILDLNKCKTPGSTAAGRISKKFRKYLES